MVSINYATREVCCKIVYYGPGLSGKTTNLQVVHQKVPQNTRGKLISLATEADRTLYFDFLPINIGSINGFAAKFQLYTVPGQVYYNATRRLVLRGVDGVVFVADAQADKHDDNMESLSNLKENLEEYGYDVNELPIVIQYNKSDLPTALSKEEMDAKLNVHNWPSHAAAAVDGVGVFDTLKAIMKLVLEKAKKGGTTTKAKPQITPNPAVGQAQSVVTHVASPTVAQGVQPAVTPAQEPAIAAHGVGAVAGESSGPVSPGGAAIAAVEKPPMKTPLMKSAAASGGGLFGAPRSSSGRSRHSTIRSGPISAATGPVDATTGPINASSGPVDAATGPVDATTANTSAEHDTAPTGIGGASDGVETSGAQTQPVNASSKAEINDSVRELSAEKQEATNQASMVGHDPLEQAPPKPKQKKPGFFSRLFGRK
jgi:mutual gliding-motility protein MglA